MCHINMWRVEAVIQPVAANEQTSEQVSSEAGKPARRSLKRTPISNARAEIKFILQFLPLFATSFFRFTCDERVGHAGV